MGKLWIPAILLGIGIASLVVAPMAQYCVTWSDGQACETAGTVALNVLGWVAIATGTLWLVLHWGRRVATAG